MASASVTPAPAARRAAVLDAALELFCERTVDGTPVPLVARRAGVGAGTIYRHFPSKEALANAVYRRCKLEMKSRVVDALPSGLSPREEFRAMWRGLLDYAAERPAALRFLELQQHAAYLDARSRAASEALFAAIAAYIRRGQRAGAIRRAPPELLISLAFGAFVGLVKASHEGHCRLGRAAARASEEAVWSMLRAGPGAE